ncbi:hypothetical protein F7734_34175 [Scytonema sp. UIC 10036]|uniref:hypothetical protein n=1 Tax=Scytonema sp. UIC 10036 TaxID=2304196 RepID=UPI00137E50C6|nr:hypothetical protein [Scytonema sp. UIC 10036]MUG97109.1 hypothetical protein [Scytonema sp. UIC 10036]
MDDVVTDDELLYRCVFHGGNYYQMEEHGVRLSSQAFADRGQAPSVDRAKLCNHNPQWTQKNTNDAVVSLVAGDIRMIDDIVQKDAKGKEIIYAYKIDVHPRPLGDNPAHAQIEPSPAYQNRNVFRKVSEKLARLATERVAHHGWEIEPYELRLNN